MTVFQAPARPRPWPGRPVSPQACALLVVDMQRDYCEPGYYMDRAGYDLRRLRAPIPRIRRAVRAAHQAGMPVIFTRQGRAAGEQTNPAGWPLTAAAGEPGWEIIPELRPLPGEAIIEKTTCNAFFSGELDALLRGLGIRSLAFCGNTVDVCVHSSLRAAADLGYDCLLLEDACGAVNRGLLRWAVESVLVENGVFGCAARAGEFVSALNSMKI